MKHFSQIQNRGPERKAEERARKKERFYVTNVGDKALREKCFL